MGQTKNRGTFEERRASAISRNTQLEATFKTVADKNLTMKRCSARTMQQLAMRLVAAQILTMR